MTHTHATVEQTEAWLASSDAARAFLDWCAHGPIEIRSRAQLVLLATMPATVLDNFAGASDWIADRSIDSDAYRQLHSAMFDDWVGSCDEHRRFHMWLADPRVVCSGCVF